MKKIIPDLIIIACLVIMAIFVKRTLDGTMAYASAQDGYLSAYSEAVDKTTHNINFTAVRAAGAPSSSWIYILDTHIDYPLVQVPDNATYLKKDAYGADSTSGAIFINFANNADMSDPKTIIFGHSMKDGTMFHDLHKYEKDDWGKTHSTAYIYLDNGEKIAYHLLCCITTTADDKEIYMTSGREDTKATAEILLKKADVAYSDAGTGNIICLSTCIKDLRRCVVAFQADAP